MPVIHVVIKQPGNHKRHQQLVYEGGNYTCGECSFEAVNRGYLEKHHQSVHKGVKYACDKCQYEFTPQNGLKKHLKSVHECMKYTCGECELQAVHSGNIKKHQKSFHEGVKYSCDECILKETQRAHTEEAERMQNTEKLQGDICPSSFQHKRDLELHKENDHNENYLFTCGEGLIKPNFDVVISRHRRTCPKMESHLKCAVCEKQFTRQRDFEYHMRRQSAYYCNQCGKTFADDDEWEQHIRTHAEIKTLQL